MTLKRKIYCLFFAIMAFLFVIVALQLSTRYSINQYLEQKRIYLTGSAYDPDGQMYAGCSIPYSQLGWIITDLRHTEYIHEAGLDPSQLDKLPVITEKGQHTDLKLCSNADGKLSQGLSFIIADVTILDKRSYDLETEPIESQYVLPADFLKLASNKYDLDSFFHFTLPIAVIREGQLADMKHMYFPPGSTEDIKIVFLLDSKTSPQNGCLFSSVVPTQTVSACIELSDYIR